MIPYSKLSRSYNHLYKEEQLKKVKIILEELSLEDERVLDVGCGTAFYSYMFKNYTGIDKSIKMLEKADANVLFGSSENLPFKDKSFDVVISVTAIHNFNDIEKAISEIKRVSKHKIAISVLKRSKKFDYIKKVIKRNFVCYKEVEEEKDIIFIITSN